MLIKFNYAQIKYHYFNNNLKWYRLDGPGYENLYGDKLWFKDGALHREGGPAIEWCDGNKFYYLNNKIYSEKEYWEIIRFKGYL